MTSTRLAITAVELNRPIAIRLRDERQITHIPRRARRIRHRHRQRTAGSRVAATVIGLEPDGNSSAVVYVQDGFATVASSNWPSPSRSHAYVRTSPGSGSLETAAVERDSERHGAGEGSTGGDRSRRLIGLCRCRGSERPPSRHGRRRPRRRRPGRQDVAGCAREVGVQGTALSAPVRRGLLTRLTPSAQVSSNTTEPLAPATSSSTPT